MSRAYCLTCNEQVHETAGGTCPLGHPVAAPDHGPEPWVGVAAPTTGWAHEAVDDHDVAMERVGMDGRHVAHAGVNGHARAGGQTNGSANGHGPDAGSDDLAALLAEALQDSAPPAQDREDAPNDLPSSGTASEASSDAEDWSDLASLAAELQLDADQAADDGPAAPPPTPTPSTPGPDPSAFDEASIDSADIDELLAELTGSSPDAAPAPEAAAPPPPPVIPPPPPEPVPVSDSIPPLDDLRSPPPTAEEPPGLWDETDLDTGVDHEAPAPPVDLTNFTARGRRVGGSGGATPRRRLGRKKKG